ncbi:hypothetical protein GCM10018773_65260 [Streptomyces candidus]|nr:hypothetical protein GCM10018773_65260 [Streptomyces candidus]
MTLRQVQQSAADEDDDHDQEQGDDELGEGHGKPLSVGAGRLLAGFVGVTFGRPRRVDRVLAKIRSGHLMGGTDSGAPSRICGTGRGDAVTLRQARVSHASRRQRSTRSSSAGPEPAFNSC